MSCCSSLETFITEGAGGIRPAAWCEYGVVKMVDAPLPPSYFPSALPAPHRALVVVVVVVPTPPPPPPPPPAHPTTAATVIVQTLGVSTRVQALAVVVAAVVHVVDVVWVPLLVHVLRLPASLAAEQDDDDDDDEQDGQPGAQAHHHQQLRRRQVVVAAGQPAGVARLVQRVLGCGGRGRQRRGGGCRCWAHRRRR